MSKYNSTALAAIDDVDLKNSINELIDAYPSSRAVIERIITYFDNSDRAAKRRKIENNDDQPTISRSLPSPKDEIVRIEDLSFQLPNRKKYDLVISRSTIYLHNTKTNTAEYQYALDDLSHEGGACVLTPDKATKNYTYTLFTTKSEDCLVFNTQDKGDVIIKTPASSETYTTDKHEQICKLITEHARIPITEPSKSYFKSTGVSASTGKVIDDKHHVTAYHKNKEGVLFFLPTGILYGFKKPTLFFPISSIASTVFTNITQRTFDMILTLKPHCRVLGSSGFKPTMEGEEASVAFSMIEQPEFDGINAYIKKLKINDQSMSEDRKAPQNSKAKQEEADDEQTGADTKGKGKATHATFDDEDEEDDDDFAPSDSDDEPLEYDTDADLDEEDNSANGKDCNEDDKYAVDADNELAAEELHEFEDAMSEDNEDGDEDEDGDGDEEEEELIDESD